MSCRSLVLVVGLMAGCSGQPRPDGTSADPAASRDPEVAVRAAIAARFKVDPSVIDMNRPLSEAPTVAEFWTGSLTLQDVVGSFRSRAM